MKKALFITVLLIAVNGYAQTNTFPTTGDVGIGTTTPGHLLHIKGVGSTTATNSLFIENSLGNPVLKVFDNQSIEFRLNSANQDAFLKSRAIHADGRFAFDISATGTPIQLFGISGTTVGFGPGDASAFQGLNAALWVKSGRTYIDKLTINPSQGVYGPNNVKGLDVTRTSIKTVLSGGTAGNFRDDLTISGRSLLFRIGDVETTAISIDASGNVGVGASTGTVSVSNGLLFDKLTGLPRIFSGNEIVYQSNNAGDQHLFANYAGTAFTGNLVTIDPGNYSGLQDNQLALLVKGKSHNVGLTVNMLGYTGIGTITPAAQLHTTGTVRFAGLANDDVLTRVIVSDANGNLAYRDAATLGGSSSSAWAYGGNTVGAATSIGTTDNYSLPFITNNVERMRIGTNGNVGIGTANINDAGYKLFVEGAVRARKVRVDQTVWSDYVFYPGYYLRPLNEVERFIKKHQHLPEVPSAAEVEKEGIDLGNNQAVLLKKIEELTLYIIEQNKQLQAQQIRIEQLEKKVNDQ